MIFDFDFSTPEVEEAMNILPTETNQVIKFSYYTIISLTTLNLLEYAAIP